MNPLSFWLVITHCLVFSGATTPTSNLSLPPAFQSTEFFHIHLLTCSSFPHYSPLLYLQVHLFTCVLCFLWCRVFCTNMFVWYFSAMVWPPVRVWTLPFPRFLVLICLAFSSYGLHYLQTLTSESWILFKNAVKTEISNFIFHLNIYLFDKRRRFWVLTHFIVYNKVKKDKQRSVSQFSFNYTFILFNHFGTEDSKCCSFVCRLFVHS